MTERLEELKLLLKEDPSDPFLRYVYALELEKTGDIHKAADDLLSLTEASPDYLAAYYQAGRLLHLKGDLQAAITILRTGIGLAIQQGNRHTLSELKFLLSELTGEDE